MHTITYRALQVTDAAMVQQTALESWKETYRDIFSLDFITTFIATHYQPDQLQQLVPHVTADQLFFDVALDAQQVIGFCNIGLRPQPTLYRIYLRPQWIGKGIGRMLLRRGEAFLQRHHVATYHCFVHQHNERGKAFYQQQGFVHQAERDTTDEWCMEKHIVPHEPHE